MSKHSGGPLGDPSARVFEVFLIVSQSVAGKCTVDPPTHSGVLGLELGPAGE